jgi:hypothetical protein
MKNTEQEKTDNSVEIGVDIFLALLCFVLGIKVWASLIGTVRMFVQIKQPYLWSAIFMIVINVGHYLLGFFDAQPDISDIPTRGLMTSFPDIVSIISRIIAFVTICPSIYLKNAISIYRKIRSNQNFDDDKN